MQWTRLRFSADRSTRLAQSSDIVPVRSTFDNRDEKILNYQQYLDESERLNVWSLCLFPCNAAHWNLRKIGQMVNYATSRCLAITKIARFIRVGKVGIDER